MDMSMQPQNGTNGQSIRVGYPSWVAHMMQFLGIVIFVGIAWGTSVEKIGHIEISVDDNTEAVKDVQTEIALARRELIEARANIKNLEREISRQEKRIERIADIMTQYLLEQEQKQPGFRGVE